MPKMAKNYVILVCSLLMVVDVIAGILGIEAEIAQNKVKDLTTWVIDCRDPSYRALKLGLAAAILLLFAHAVASLISGCIWTWSREQYQRASSRKQLAVAFLICSWIILVVAFIILIIGALSNSRSRESCGVSHSRLLSMGGILCFIHGVFSIAYYLTASAYRKEETKLHNAAGAMPKI